MSPIWGYSLTETLLNSLQTVQNNANRSILRNDYYALSLSTNQIRCKFDILNVRQISKYEMAMRAYKINKKNNKNKHRYSTNLRLNWISV